MRAKRTILAIDVGTTSMRGILFDSNGSTLATKSVHTNQILDGSHIEQSPAVLRGGLLEICAGIRREHAIDAISITAFRSAVTLVDRQGVPLRNFIMWQDTRNHEICERLRCHDAAVYQKSGAKVNTVFSAAKLLWLKENEPDVYSKAYKAMVVPDYLIHIMTGAFVTDRSYGSRSHLMNIESLEWDDSLLSIFSLDRRLLCDLADQGTVVGNVRQSFCELTGIEVGTPVISAGGDQQCGALGLGVLETGTLAVNNGTGSFVLSLADSPNLSNPSMICNVSAIKGKYIQESNVLASASALNWLIEEFFPELWGDTPDFQSFDEIAGQAARGSNGLFCIPHFQGCGTRDWNPNARAAFWGVSLGTSKADMARALYEGIAAEIAKSIDVLPLPSRRSARVFAAGGLSKSRIFNQILADMLDREVYVYADPQATAIGAFMSAAVALGLYGDFEAALSAVRGKDHGSLFAPNPSNSSFYADYKEKTERIYRLMLETEIPL